MKTKLFNLLFNVLVALFLGATVAQFYPVNPLAASLATFTGLSVVRLAVAIIAQVTGQPKTIGGMAFMAVQTEVWENFIAENLFKDYAWVRRAKDRTAFVIGNAVVHIPQAGAKPKAVKNRENYPIPVVKRNDTDVTYAIDEISTETTLIPDADKIELSYDKIASVFGDHVGVISEEAARNILHQWYPSGADNIVETTGASIAAHLTDATGNRKKFTVADVASAKTKLVKATKREMGNRALILDEDMYNQLKSDSVLTDKDTVDSVGGVWQNGDLVKVHGFDIIRTDVNSRYDNTSTPVLKDLDAANASTDNAVALLVDFNYVHFAQGEIKFFESINDVNYQGDAYNALVRIGGRKERNDQVGVIAIVQDAA